MEFSDINIERVRYKHGQLRVRRWERFNVDRDRVHRHDFSDGIHVDGEYVAVCSCGQTQRHL